MSWSDNERLLSDNGYNPSKEDSYRFEKELKDCETTLCIFTKNNKMDVHFHYNCDYNCCAKLFYSGDFSIDKVKRIEFSFLISHYIKKVDNLIEEYT